MTDTTLATVTAKVRSFRFDPDDSIDMRCPDCEEGITITEGQVFHWKNGVADGIRLPDDDGTLGDLIDAAAAHQCLSGDDGD